MLPEALGDADPSQGPRVFCSSEPRALFHHKIALEQNRSSDSRKKGPVTVLSTCRVFV